MSIVWSILKLIFTVLLKKIGRNKSNSNPTIDVVEKEVLIIQQNEILQQIKNLKTLNQKSCSQKCIAKGGNAVAKININC